MARADQAPFYRQQQREVLAQCGRVDPRKIEEAVARGGYAAAAKALLGMKPEGVIAEVSQAVSREALTAALAARAPKKTLELNKKALQAGFKVGRRLRGRKE